MATLDLKILSFLYDHKIDNDFHDVSVIFSFKEKLEDITGETLLDGSEIKIINSYSTYKQNLFRKIISRIFRRIKNKDIIDECVISLEDRGYVTKIVKGRMTFFELVEGDDYSYSNNSICKITQDGIKYFEENYRYKRTNLLSIISLIIATAALLISLLTTKN